MGRRQHYLPSHHVTSLFTASGVKVQTYQNHVKLFQDFDIIGKLMPMVLDTEKPAEPQCRPCPHSTLLTSFFVTGNQLKSIIVTDLTHLADRLLFQNQLIWRLLIVGLEISELYSSDERGRLGTTCSQSNLVTSMFSDLIQATICGHWTWLREYEMLTC